MLKDAGVGSDSTICGTASLYSVGCGADAILASVQARHAPPELPISASFVRRDGGKRTRQTVWQISLLKLLEALNM